MGLRAASKCTLLVFLILFHNVRSLAREPVRWPLAPFVKQANSIDRKPRTLNPAPTETKSDPSHRVGFYMAPLIGGPSWLPLHVKLFIEAEDGTRHLLDFVPKDATNPDVTGRLMTLQCVPGDVRYACHIGGGKLGRQYDTRVVLDPSGDGAQYLRAPGRQRLGPRSELRIVERAVQYSAAYPDRDLHLLTNNCWSFAARLYLHLLSASE
jgi:hypothetical protein